ncbi:MAG TPA: hypothetical protein VMZ73_04290 [Acidimicrobiales bacterium]|nr:hypothetical protein [Acidimicrobiales bacterium]
MDTDHRDVPGEEFLDPHLEPPSVGEMDLGDAAPEEDDAEIVGGLFELPDDLWGSDDHRASDQVPGPGFDDLTAGVVVEAEPADDLVSELLFAPAGQEYQPSRHTAGSGRRRPWADMAPRRRYALAVAGSACLLVALLAVTWLQRPHVSDDVVSTGTLRTTTSVVARALQPAPTSGSTSTSTTTSPPATVDGPPATAITVPPAPTAAAVAPNVTAAVPPPAPQAPVTTPARPAQTTPVTTPVVATTTATVATIPPPAEETPTTRRNRAIPTTITTEPEPSTTVAPAEAGT